MQVFLAFCLALKGSSGQGAPMDDEEPSIPGLPYGAAARLEVGHYWHEAPVISAFIPPDGQSLISLDRAGCLTAWDRLTKRRLYRVQVTDPAFDGRRITSSPRGTWVLLEAPASVPPMATVFRRTTGDELCRIERCSGAVFTGQDRVITAWRGRKVRRWDVEGGQELAPLESSPAEILSLGVSEDGGRIVAAVTGAEEPVVWDGRTGRHVPVPASGVFQSIAVAVSSDGRTLAVGNRWFVNLWDASGAAPRLLGPLEAAGGPPLRFSSDGKRLVGAHRPKRIEIWDWDRRTRMASYWYPSTIYGFFEPSARADEVIHARGPWVVIEPLSTAEDEPAWLPASSPIEGVGFTEEGQGVTGEPRGTIRRWEATSAQLLRTHEVGRFSRMMLSRSGRRAALLDNPGTLRVWDLARDVEALKIGRLNHVSAFAWSPEADLLALGTYDRFISIWGVDEQTERIRIPTEGIAPGGIAWCPDGKSIAWGEPSGEVVFAEIRRGRELSRYRSRGAAITSISYLPGGDSVVTGDSLGAVRRWADVPHAEPGLLGRLGSRVTALAVSPDGHWVAGGDSQGAILLWPVGGGVHRALSVEEASEITSLAFSPDGTLLLAGTAKNAALVWKVYPGP